MQLDSLSNTLVIVPPPGKRHAELLELEAGIQEQLDSGTAADPEYWQAVLKRLALHKAKARLREIHAGAGLPAQAPAPVCCLLLGGQSRE